ncbi:MAG TPA: ABC transporter permease [Gaiellales bacterium]|jgi:peptide/nickel transport system permease protein|nr:ABC transporter permease [Gaiellales bacterium]
MSAAAEPGRVERRLAFTRSWSVRIGLTVLAFVLGTAFIGPYFAPYSPSALPGFPYATPSGTFWLGTDYLGEDVFSRVLSGGRTVILYGALATLLAYAVGGTIGLLAGYTRSRLDDLLMRSMDVLLAFPPILFLLVIATGAGSNIWALVIAIAVIHVPSIARILRSAALEVSVRGYVEAAIARGDRTHVILRREILPNIWGTIVADGGPRFTVSILLVAAVNFLGLGLSPPAADWAMMISENRSGITINIWAVVAPALMIGALTVSINVVADAIAGRLGKSIETEALRR